MLRHQLQVTQPVREQLPQSPMGRVQVCRRKGRGPRGAGLRALSGWRCWNVKGSILPHLK